MHQRRRLIGGPTLPPIRQPQPGQIPKALNSKSSQASSQGGKAASMGAPSAGPNRSENGSASAKKLSTDMSNEFARDGCKIASRSTHIGLFPNRSTNGSWSGSAPAVPTGSVAAAKTAPTATPMLPAATAQRRRRPTEPLSSFCIISSDLLSGLTERSQVSLSRSASQYQIIRYLSTEQ